MREVFTYASLPSTQTRATELARLGVADGALVIAHEQTEGRGRHGRTWLSGEGSLCFSLVLTRWIEPETAFHWSFVAAVALADALQLRIKWPNDLYLEKKKVGGILATLETEPPAVILGVGLNLTFRPEGALQQRAGAIGKPADARTLADAIEDERTRYLAEGPKALARRVRERLCLVGEKVHVVSQSGNVLGVIEGIDDSFQLQLRGEQGQPLLVSAAEVWPVEGA